jgi:hypothetical protein
VLWPLTFAVIVAGVVAPWPPAEALELALWLSPAVLEYALVHTGVLPYRPWRTGLFGALMGVGLGRTFHRYVLEPTDPLAWAALLSTGVVCGLAALYHFSVKNREL